MILYTILLILIYLPIKLLFPVKVIGKKNVPKDSPYILVSNHLSWKDLFIVSVNILGYRKFIGKKELGKCFLVRWLVKGIGSVLVDRQNIDLTSIRTCVNSLKKGTPLLIFPEGTRNRTGTDKLQEIKQGAAMMAIKGGAPFIPTIIYNKQRLFRRNYIYIGKPVHFTKFSEGRLDSEKLAGATELISNVMIDTKIEMENFIKSKKRKRK